jgi:hypothetical protein
MEVCQTPRCTRLAFVVLDGVALCRSVPSLGEQNGGLAMDDRCK